MSGVTSLALAPVVRLPAPHESSVHRSVRLHDQPSVLVQESQVPPHLRELARYPADSLTRAATEECLPIIAHVLPLPGRRGRQVALPRPASRGVTGAFDFRSCPWMRQRSQRHRVAASPSLALGPSRELGRPSSTTAGCRTPTLGPTRTRAGTASEHGRGTTARTAWGRTAMTTRSRTASHCAGDSRRTRFVAVR